jgi:hypothetical protein
MVAAPGAGLSLLLFGAGRGPLATQVGLVVPFGVAWVATAAFVLALLHALTLPAFLAVYLAGTVAAWAAIVRRRDLAETVRSWVRDVRAERWSYAGGLVVLAAVAVTRLSYSPILNLADQTPLRYWADGLEIADAHRIPALSLQWGRLFPSSVSKVVLNAFSAAASLVLGRGPLGPMGALLVVGSIGLLLATFALARELGLRHTAPLVVLVLFANHVLGPRSLSEDLLNYRAETWGRLLVVAALVLSVRALRRRETESSTRGEVIAAGVMFGLGAGTHLVPTVIGLSFLGAYATGLALFEGRVRSVAVGSATCLAVAAVVAAIVLLVPRGDVGFQGAGDTSVYRTLASELGLPSTFDPTRYLALGELRQTAHAGAFYEPPSAVYHEYVRRVVGEERLRRPFLALLPVAGILTLVVILAWGTSRLRALAVACALTAAAVLMVALAFDYRFDVYVLAEFGPRRLFDYTAIPAVLLAAGVIELGLRRLGSKAGVVGLAGALVFGALAVPRNVASPDRKAFFETARAPLAWLESNVPCEGRILADRRTLATFETLTRHAGRIEGMGPYLRPPLLGVAIRSLLDAQTFFADPAAGADYLRREGIAAVVATTYDQTLGGVGGPLKSSSDVAKLQAVPFLEPVPEASSATVRVFRVVGLVPAAPARGLDRLPGYRCG